MADAPDNGNGTSQRVTNANLRSDIDYLRRDLANWTDEVRVCIREARDERRENQQRINALETEVGRLDERVTSSNRMLAGLQLVGSTIAAAIGSAVK